MSRRHDRGTERGQALLELAIVAPVIILLIAGLVQFAVIFERQIGINNAIRDAARIAATWDSKDIGTASSNAAATVTKVQTLLTNAQTYDANQMTIEVCIGTPSANQTDPSGNYQVDVKITVTYKHPLFMPIVDLVLDGIDGTGDGKLAATNVTEFHVEHDNTTPITMAVAPQVSSSPAGVASCSI